MQERDRPQMLQMLRRSQAAHSAARRTRRGAMGSPLATAGGLGRSPTQERDRPQMLRRSQAAHSAARRTRRGAMGSPLATAGGLGRSPIYQKMASGFTGEPVPPGTRSGAITSMKSH